MADAELEKRAARAVKDLNRLVLALGVEVKTPRMEDSKPALEPHGVSPSQKQMPSTPASAQHSSILQPFEESTPGIPSARSLPPVRPFPGTPIRLPASSSGKKRKRDAHSDEYGPLGGEARQLYSSNSKQDPRTPNKQQLGSSPRRRAEAKDPQHTPRSDKKRKPGQNCQ